ncbi:protein kinase domain-containing protein [Cohnella caldifontis]|uniref:protein kinase domain-containing protein n=1 Tax=Cohnella caldifontis TaxID=3027471 RepID=UPI0023ED81DA|nr:serine/threonine protein kinase [Cohnella sp. YIM B05605]
MTTSFKPELLLQPGTVVTGKWNGKKYKLERVLGAGANGQVYLASVGRSVCALKIGTEAAELQGEANVLASLDGKERGRGRPPFLLDVDDFQFNGRALPFYSMRYVPGIPVRSYLRRHGGQWVGVIGHRLLERLAELHEAGWVFSDLKNDNVLVHDYGRVELVDYGGMTAMGRAVRQFTEIYDRGYWSAGSRTADAAYDWFAFAVLWLHATDAKRLFQLSRSRLPQDRGIEDLMKLIRSNPKLRPIEQWLGKALRGQFRDTREALKEWRAAHRASDAAVRSRIPAWMTGMLVFSAALCLTLAALWLF